MKRATLIIIAATFVIAATMSAPVLAADATAPAAAKPKDPAYVQIDDVPGLPRVLLIGDSVSVGYTLPVRKELVQVANIHRPAANCGSTKTGLRDLDRWLGAGHWDVIHFNWGLHDLGYRFDDDSNVNANGEYARPDNGGHQNVPPEQYEKNLRELVGRLKQTGAKLVFATTTPVPADLHAYVKGAERPYNEMARNVMREAGVTVNDLWSFSQTQLAEIQQPGNPHFTAKGSAVLAREIARVIKATLTDAPLSPARMDTSSDANSHKPFAPQWPSLEKYRVPDWFRDAKFGIFVHWGPQTLAGSNVAGDGTKTRNWKELAAAFQGAKFDAEQWARLFAKSGARYVVQVAEHHDGYALYDSSRTAWTSVKMAPRRDFVKELSTAVRAQGLIYGASSHTEENWWFYSEPRKKLPPLPKPSEAAAGEQPPKEWLDDWHARLVEIVEKYDPQLFWFDWAIEQPCYEPYRREFAAHYYNRAARQGRGVVLNYKYEAYPAAAAVLDISVNTGRARWAPEGIQPLPWQFDTWSARGLWFWRPTLTIRPTAELIAEMADVVSKNGNYLLNVTPDPDGLITPEQVAMLDEFGRWLAVNGEAIYGTRPWKVFGEGPTAGLGPSFKPDVPKTPYTGEDIRFTTKGQTLYAIVLAWPETGQVSIGSLAQDAPGALAELARVSLLGSKRAVTWRRGGHGLTVDLAEHERSHYPFVLKIEDRKR